MTLSLFDWYSRNRKALYREPALSDRADVQDGPRSNESYNIARKAAVIRQHEVMICQLMVFGWEDGTVDSAMFCNVMKGYAKLW